MMMKKFVQADEIVTINTMVNPENQLYTIYEEDDNKEKPTSTNCGYSASPTTSYYTTYLPGSNYVQFNNAYYHDVIKKLKDCRYTFNDEDIIQKPRSCFYKNHCPSKTNPLNMSEACQTFLSNQSDQPEPSIPHKRYKFIPRIRQFSISEWVAK